MVLKISNKVQKYCLVLIVLLLVPRIISDEYEESDAELIDEYLKSTNNSPEKAPLSTKNGTSTHGPCKCVKYYQCNSQGQSFPNNTEARQSVPNNTEVSPSDASAGGLPAGVTSGDILGIVDIRQNVNDGKKTSANGCQHYFDVCCANAKNETTEVNNPTTATTVDSEEPKMPIKNLTSWVHKQCGLRNENGIGFKITGATKGESQFGEFPWTIAVVHEQPVQVGNQTVNRNVLLCGGSLLHPQVVLTAAHCIFQIANSAKKSELKIRVGEWDSQTLDEPYPHQDRYIKEVVIHEQLYRKGLFNDVALLILESQVKLAPNVDTICVPPLNTNTEDFNGQSCFSSGWGKDNFGAEGRYQEIMKKVELPIVPRKSCEMSLRKSRLGDGFRLHDSFICAGGEPSKDTCVGDGGSPLVCKSLNSPSYIQLGIVAWGIGCGTSVPAVYVNVAKFTPWIFQHMKQRNFQTQFCSVDI